MIQIIKNRFFSSNTYLMSSNKNQNTVIIDPGLDYERIDAAIQQHNLFPKYILSTHGHFDHVSSVAFFQKKYGAIFLMHEKDIKELKRINFYMKVMGIDKKVKEPVADLLIRKEFEKLDINDFNIKSYNLPGHTDGSCLFVMNNIIFTGDTLYYKGIGDNPFPGQDKVKLKKSLLNILDRFSDDMIVYPGHGNAGFLGEIKSKNTELNYFLNNDISI